MSWYLKIFKTCLPRCKTPLTIFQYTKFSVKISNLLNTFSKHVCLSRTVFWQLFNMNYIMKIWKLTNMERYPCIGHENKKNIIAALCGRAISRRGGRNEILARSLGFLFILPCNISSFSSRMFLKDTASVRVKNVFCFVQQVPRRKLVRHAHQSKAASFFHLIAQIGERNSMSV